MFPRRLFAQRQDVDNEGGYFFHRVTLSLLPPPPSTPLPLPPLPTPPPLSPPPFLSHLSYPTLIAPTISAYGEVVENYFLGA